MTVKEKVLKELEGHRGEAISGQELAEELGVSRTSVWKAIESLRKAGYNVLATNNKGYMLADDTDRLSHVAIEQYLGENAPSFRVEVEQIVESTNLEVKRRAVEGAREGLVILAEEQTKGRGRLGRNFYSPSQTGIYMSLLLKPKMDATDAVLITTAASVAVCRAIREVTELEPTIKWVNDIYVGEHKVCGILTEGVTDFETGNIDSVILGIGINVKTEDFPDEIKKRAGSLSNQDTKISRNQLAAAIIVQVGKVYQDLTRREFLEDYRTWSNVINREIRYLSGEQWIEAKATGIDQNGGLVVQKQDGQSVTLSTGEITVRFR